MRASSFQLAAWPSPALEFGRRHEILTRIGGEVAEANYLARAISFCPAVEVLGLAHLKLQWHAPICPQDGTPGYHRMRSNSSDLLRSSLAHVVPLIRLLARAEQKIHRHCVTCVTPLHALSLRVTLD